MGNRKVFSDIMYDRNPRVFFDIEIDGEPAGRIVMELFVDTTPKFRELCTGENGIGNRGKPLHYKGSKTEMMHGKEYLSEERGIRHGEPFEEEFYRLGYNKPRHLFFHAGFHSFYISLRRTYRTMFGNIVDGMDVLEAVNNVDYNYNLMKPVTIGECGQLDDNYWCCN